MEDLLAKGMDKAENVCILTSIVFLRVNRRGFGTPTELTSIVLGNHNGSQD